VLEQHPGSLYAQVGEAMSRWPSGALGALRRLEQANEDSGLVKVQLGITLYWLGQDAAAAAAWRQAEDADPDSPAAIRAETLLHPDMPPGRPFFVASAPLPRAVSQLPAFQQLAELERRARDARDAEAWIAYGAALQRAGRTVSARRAFDRAARIAPNDPEALAAAAVIRFDKDAPARAFSRLGPLSQRFPEAGVVRFHLGLMLLWLGQVDEARVQLQAAVDDEPGSIYSRQASQLLERLDEPAAGSG
jgi:tetratricopeptide (TPR) repeat protein